SGGVDRADHIRVPAEERDVESEVTGVTRLVAVDVQPHTPERIVERLHECVVASDGDLAARDVRADAGGDRVGVARVLPREDLHPTPLVLRETGPGESE